MTEFEFGGFSCRTEGSGGTLALLFSGFDRELFADVGGILAQSGGGVWRNSGISTGTGTTPPGRLPGRTGACSPAAQTVWWDSCRI